METEYHNIKEKAVNIIASYFGANTAGLYKEYYKDKNEDLVIISLRELLTEIVGVDKAENVLKDIK
jgi:hypothetical protein